MKRVRSTVSYYVPHWDYCNSDLSEFSSTPKPLCRFAVKTKTGYRCALHGMDLKTDGQWVDKAGACIKATRGLFATIEVENAVPATPAVDPQRLIKATIDVYSKTVNDLVKQGYPRQVAEQAAKQHLLGK